MLEILEEVFRTVVEYCALGLEIVGVLIVVWTAIKCVYEMFKRDVNVRLDLAEGIATALEFKLAGEVLKTTIVSNWNELGTLGAIMLLRAAITVLLHWEVQNEKKAREA